MTAHVACIVSTVLLSSLSIYRKCRTFQGHSQSRIQCKSGNNSETVQDKDDRPITTILSHWVSHPHCNGPHVDMMNMTLDL